MYDGKSLCKIGFCQPIDRGSALKIGWREGSGWSPGWIKPRELCICLAGPTIEADTEPLATVEATDGDSDTFFTLFQLCSLDGCYEHVREWPRYWHAASDRASTCACPVLSRNADERPYDLEPST